MQLQGKYGLTTLYCLELRQWAFRTFKYLCTNRRTSACYKFVKLMIYLTILTSRIVIENHVVAMSTRSCQNEKWYVVFVTCHSPINSTSIPISNVSREASPRHFETNQFDLYPGHTAVFCIFSVIQFYLLLWNLDGML